MPSDVPGGPSVNVRGGPSVNLIGTCEFLAFAQSESELTTPSVESGGTVRGTSAMALKRVCVSRD